MFEIPAPSSLLLVPLARCRWRRTAGRLVGVDPSYSSSLACETSRFILSKRGPVSFGHTPPASVAGSPPSPEMTVGTRLLRNSMFALWHFHSRRLCGCTVTALPPTSIWEIRPPVTGQTTVERLHPGKTTACQTLTSLQVPLCHVSLKTKCLYTQAPRRSANELLS